MSLCDYWLSAKKQFRQRLNDSSKCALCFFYERYGATGVQYVYLYRHCFTDGIGHRDGCTHVDSSFDIVYSCLLRRMHCQERVIYFYPLWSTVSPECYAWIFRLLLLRSSCHRYRAEMDRSRVLLELGVAQFLVAFHYQLVGGYNLKLDAVHGPNMVV